MHITPITERVQRSGNLIGPLPYVKRPSGCYVPDYRHPGVAARVAAEVDMIEDMCYDRRKL